MRKYFTGFTVFVFPQSWLFSKHKRLQGELEEWRGLSGHSERAQTQLGRSVQNQNQKQQAKPGGGLPHCRDRAEDSKTAGPRWQVPQFGFSLCKCWHLMSAIIKHSIPWILLFLVWLFIDERSLISKKIQSRVGVFPLWDRLEQSDESVLRSII